MLVVNLFGGPGSGKSTTAAGLFFLMKNGSVYSGSVELVTEFAKDLTYAERHKELQGDNQLYITAKQYNRLHRLRNQVDIAITDSPLIQSLMYTPVDYFPSYGSLLRELYDSFDNMNFYINRVKEYKQYGRIQTEKEAGVKGNMILNFLKNSNLEFQIIDGNVDGPINIIKALRKHKMFSKEN